MNLETLVAVFLIGAIAAIIGRAVAGYSLAGCLTAYVAACLGGVGGWFVQQRYFGLDNLLVLPITSFDAPVSVVGMSMGALLLAFIAGLLGRPTYRPRARRR